MEGNEILYVKVYLCSTVPPPPPPPYIFFSLLFLIIYVPYPFHLLLPSSSLFGSTQLGRFGFDFEWTSTNNNQHRIIIRISNNNNDCEEGAQ